MSITADFYAILNLYLGGWGQAVLPISEVRILFLAAFTILQKATVSFVMSVCPHGTYLFPLHGFS
jgi:hypothetical protein